MLIKWAYFFDFGTFELAVAFVTFKGLLLLGPRPDVPGMCSGSNIWSFRTRRCMRGAIIITFVEKKPL